MREKRFPRRYKIFLALFITTLFAVAGCFVLSALDKVVPESVVCALIAALGVDTGGLLWSATADHKSANEHGVEVEPEETGDYDDDMGG